MSSENDSRLKVQPAVASAAQQIKEAVSEYRSATPAAENDTLMSSAGETEAIWPNRASDQPGNQTAVGIHARRVRRNRPQRNRAAIDANQNQELTAYRGDATTSHSRRDLLTGDWTIFASLREQRPNEYAPLETQLESRLESQRTACTADHLAIDPACPFCCGSEQQTPDAVWSARLGELTAETSGDSMARFARPAAEIVHGGQDNWDVRVVPNKFPAVSPCSDRNETRDNRQTLFPIADVVGGHEVVIESSHHAESMLQLDSSSIFLALLAYRDRIRHWRDIPGIEYISVFKNSGLEAGASLRHSHSQLVATSIMPHRVASLLARTEAHRARTGCSLGCDLLRAELAEKKRIIGQTDSLVAFCPFASRFAGLIRITSIAHQPHFERLSDASLDHLSSLLWRVLSWVNRAFPGKAFNYMLHTCPPGSKQPESFQWSLDVFPRLNKVAGFEWSSDCMINSMLPEVAAEQYRQVARQSDPRNVLAIR
ncbi:DUF4921 family protein [Stieleria sp. TO1_6]|uniref:galactose-1-phosphate uridylyltransferase n=1 Tax=Stieleria tagensis TaxID=2956795 RepID=UPI00209ABFD0|nr:DUF4921 family protein [Stieleria tagensis]MCO8124524.1 DUF4921 family protein [Stieleria tagensis]